MQGLPTGDVIGGMGRNSRGQGHWPSRNMEAIRVGYARVIQRNWMLEDDYTGMVTSTLMYAMHKKV